VPLVSLAALLLCTTIVGAYAARVLRSGRARHPRLGDHPGSALLPGWLVEAFYGALGAPGQALARLGVEPDTLTYLSLACSLASAPLLATGRFPEGALAVAVGGCLDALDGMVARAQGRASAAGAVLDSVVDRLSDAAPLAGLAVFYRGSAATLLGPLAAMTASSLVSYARARADVHQLALPNGLMRRHERIAYLLLSLLLAPLAPSLGIAPGVPCPATLAGVIFIAAASFVAAAILVERTRAALGPPAILPTHEGASAAPPPGQRGSLR
jgi:CDP-diacylglycerol--glycerol-3-phosphate 3-phosphatidyltransferase